MRLQTYVPVCVVIALFTCLTFSQEKKGNRLEVHEWGTFTSIAGLDGKFESWQPLDGRFEEPLPKFVYRDGNARKRNMQYTVRMETPVLYFYAPEKTEVSLKVGFPKGIITEWYPGVSMKMNAGLERGCGHSIDWGTFWVSPKAKPSFPLGKTGNHYFEARNTDAAPVHVSTKEKNEFEKFLFYRGAGNFSLPLSVTLDEKHLTLKNTSKEPIPALLVFEKKNSKFGYSLHKNLAETNMRVERPTFSSNQNGMLADLKRVLVKEGLFEKEAAAMIQTWRKTWFEDGLRVFFIVPRPATDRILPITINPKPATLVRVMVGRVEVLTPEHETFLIQVLKSLPKAEANNLNFRKRVGDRGRFAQPILRRLLNSKIDEKVKKKIRLIYPSGC